MSKKGFKGLEEGTGRGYRLIIRRSLKGKKGEEKKKAKHLRKSNNLSFCGWFKSGRKDGGKGRREGEEAGCKGWIKGKEEKV